MKRLIVSLGILLLACCCSARAQQSEVPIREVSYCDLAKTPQIFSGERIRVRAIYKYGFELQQLDPPVCCPEHGGKIWVEIEPSELKGNSLALFRRFPKGMGLVLVTLVGTFESGGPYGDGAYHFKFNVDQIEKLEAKAKASPTNPAWVPQNCEKPDATQTRPSEQQSPLRNPE